MFNFTKVSEGAREIARQMIENPHDWVQDQYYYRNKTNQDIQIWTANGAFGLQFYGNNGLTWAEKRYLNNAIKKSIANKLLSNPTPQER